MRFPSRFFLVACSPAKGSRVATLSSGTQYREIPANEYVTRHRRSKTAGVSWPNDDDHHAGGEDKQVDLPAGRLMTRSIIVCVLSSARSRVRLRAKPLVRM
jgi:hypothetical protein